VDDMGYNVFQKVLKPHIVSGSMEPGKEVAIKIDQTLTQDATGTMAYLQFETLGLDEVKTELSVSYIDHNTLQVGFENADDHKYLQSIAMKYGIYLSKAGNGICHQVHLERFIAPGKTLLGSDSHTPTAGGMGAIAIGAGGLDVAVAMAGKPFYFTMPKVIKINLTGRLNPWVSAKDVILKVLQILTTKGNVGYVVEYGGEGVKTLSIPERATITNMGAELGVTTSIFPSDEITRDFLRRQGREDEWQEIIADEDAEYDRVIDLDLSSIEPMVALPHSPDNVVSVREAGRIKVDQVAIGSCTNSSFRDIMVVAEALSGERAHPEVSFVVAMGSRQVFLEAIKRGALEKLVLAGARIMELACGFCIGNGQSPPYGGHSVRTSNRNFLGRSGTKNANVYLVSPEVAAATVIAGELADPRDVFKNKPYPQIELPDRFIVDDGLLIKPLPKEERKKIKIYRGPNIAEPFKNEPLKDTIKGVVTIKVGDKITTDHIMPAGTRLKYRSNVPKYAEFVFETVDETFSRRAKENKEKGIDNIIVGGWSYGQGSSREHAAICPAYLGVKAVIAKTLERIHSANLINFGIVPLVFTNEEDYEKIEQGDEIVIENIHSSLRNNQPIKLINKTKNIEITLTYNLSDRQKEILLAGGYLNYALKQ